MRLSTRVVLSSFSVLVLCSGWGLQGRPVLGSMGDSAAVPDQKAPSFESQEPMAVAPFPPDGAEGVRRSNLTLAWTPGARAVAHHLRFGTDPNHLELLGTVQDPEAGISPLALQTRYHWRVDEVRSGGSTVKGPVWGFTTGGLVACWKLDETDGNSVADASGHDHTGTLAGNAKWQPSGRLGGALELDGNGDYVDLGNSPAFNCAEEITVAAWVKVNKFDKRWQALVTKGDTAWRLAREVSTEGVQFAVGYPEEMRLVRGVIDVNDGEWHHIAGVHDGQRVYLYVDGRLDGSAYGPGGIHTNDYPVYIGENSQNRGRYWNGLIDDVHLYNAALEHKQIKALAAGEIPTTAIAKVGLRSATAQERAKSTALIGWWRLDEAEGSEAADSSGNDIQGHLLGNAQWQPGGGKIGGALKLDGRGDCVEIANESLFDITREITVAAWIKVERFDKDWQALVTKGDSAWRLHRYMNRSTLAFHGNGLGTEQSGGGVEGGRAVNDGEWHHAAAVYDGSAVSLYIDGGLDRSVSLAGRIRTNDYPVLLGENAQRTGREWNGMIDEVCIFQYSLDANEIGALCGGEDPLAAADRMMARRATAAAEGEPHQQDPMDSVGQPQARRNRNLFAVLAVIAVATALAGGSLLVRQK